MRVLNMMLGRNPGGIEQSCIDYYEALTLAGHEVLTITRPGAWVNEPLAELDAPVRTLAHLGEWDPLAARKLRRIAREWQADIAIGQGNRAIGLGLRALKKRVPVVAVAQNYKIKRFPQCDGVFCTTEDLINEMIARDIPRDRVFHMPNMARVPEGMEPRNEFHTPRIIGSMGRFVEKKGFTHFLQALSILKKADIPFTAKLGGGGALEDELKAEAKAYGLEEELEFSGWVKDKRAFFDEIDIFVLPSLHEPFGIVLIEAMAHGLPCITTDSEGPCEIIEPGADAMLVPKADPAIMAEALRELIEHPDNAAEMAANALQKVTDIYDVKQASKRLDAAINALLTPLSQDKA